jgi:hypothetical protein
LPLVDALLTTAWKLRKDIPAFAQLMTAPATKICSLFSFYASHDHARS